MSETFIVQSQPQTFGAEQLEDLRTLLIQLDEGTVRRPITVPQDLELDDKGRLKENGFALSSLAYTQICNHLAAGLWRLTTDISGVNRWRTAFDDVISLPLAVQIFNKCATLRFRMQDGICGREMIQNHTTRVVDGIVGPRYQYLAHHQLLDAAVDVLASAPTPMCFHSGVLVGRRLSIVFTAAEPLVTLRTGEALVEGCYFTNSEAGECSVAGAAVLHIQDTALRCLMPIKHVAHSGKSFNKKLGHLFTHVLVGADTLKVAAKAAQAQLDGRLNLTGIGGVIKARRNRLRTKLYPYMEKAVARDMVRRIMFTGANGEINPQAPTSEISSRHVYDVFITLMKIADGQYPEVRENLERAAYDVLTNKVNLLIGK